MDSDTRQRGYFHLLLESGFGIPRRPARFSASSDREGPQMVWKARRENGAVIQRLQIGVLYLREQCRGERFGSRQQTRVQQQSLPRS